MSTPSSSTGAGRPWSMWVLPTTAAVLFGVAGWWIQATVQAASKEALADQLISLMRADVAALEMWSSGQRSALEITADEPEMRDAVARLVNVDRPDAPSWAEIRAYLQTHLAPRLSAHGWEGFAVLDTEGRAVAASIPGVVGQRPLNSVPSVLDRALAGESLVSAPFFSVLLGDERTSGPMRPTMVVLAPVHNDDGAIMGILCATLSPERDFSRILSLARHGDSGETIAFDARGVLLTRSRFDASLRAVGLLPQDRAVSSVLVLELRDPGGNLLRGFRPQVARASLPFTREVDEALAVRPAELESYERFDVDGFRDYRGVNVVAAWTWLSDHDFGVATKVDSDEAYATVQLLRRAFAVLFALLALMAAGTFVFAWALAVMRRRAARAAVEARQLGPYALESAIGSGGMGEVYRARHALLRRPTAVKLLRPERSGSAAVARFEREVQLTCRLTHPNTIAIYDYGHTPEGVFYYAMELLDGASLQEVIEYAGPLPESRIIHIALQAAGSLAEAHAAGLVHRDVKPANLFLCERGGVFDTVKVLDFGLVREVDARGEEASGDEVVAGTPAYVAPEAIVMPHKVGVASDIYAFGAVLYALLTGRPPFDGATPLAIYLKHVNETPARPSVARGAAVDPRLESLVLRCLAKQPGDRPTSMDGIADVLRTCAAAGHWGPDEARRWWHDHRPGLDNRRNRPLAGSRPTTLPVDTAARLAAR